MVKIIIEIKKKKKRHVTSNLRSESTLFPLASVEKANESPLDLSSQFAPCFLLTRKRFRFSHQIALCFSLSQSHSGSLLLLQLFPSNFLGQFRWRSNF